jgi:lysophospholipid acyltransferase (LPLAT)-like uncharacterized protein
VARIRVSPKLAGCVIAAVVKLIGRTLRIRIDDRAGLLAGTGPPEPLIWVVWHDRIFMVCATYWRHVRHRRGAILTSASRDGEILAQTGRRLRLEAVRGSSSRRKVAALRESMAVLERGLDLCITPDGPRGPRHSLQPGVILLAQTTGARIVAVHARPSHCWQLKSWDRFIIPRPFSRIDVVFELLESIPPTGSQDDFEAQKLSLEARMRAGTGESAA